MLLHKSKHSELQKRILSALLSAAMVLSILPPMTLPARAAGETYTFSSGAVLLDSSFDGDNVIIQNGVFSVTVSGATDVNIIFEDVVIDRRYSSDAANGTQVTMTDAPDGYSFTTLYAVSQELGWGTTAPTCPFLVTGNSTVTVGFRGTCTFYAGTNGCTVSTDSVYTAVSTGAGFAGIQVDSGSSLTIAYAEDLTVYGAHQLGTPDEDGNVVGTDTNYGDALRANADIDSAGYDDPWDTPYRVPSGAVNNQTSGGAGIGGGAAYDTSSSGTSDYTAGTPGTIIINGGNIEAFGGHQAAGIGGGVNGASTTDKIVINAGTVTAHGGRWAAGIGDGDSTPNDGTTNTSTMFEASSLIEINGGTVTSYGGVGSSGIGCSDGLSAVGMTSGMEIAVNGGVVHAFSGFPDKFSGTHTDGSVAPAAIGAGAGSNMDSNSIYISSQADLACAGFGNYSLTEVGTNGDTVPTIIIDSDGYLLLLRTEDYYSTAERVLTLYYPQKVENTNTGKACIVYVNQGDDENDTDAGSLYYLDPDTDTIYDENFEVVNVENVPQNLTLYVDENSVPIQSIDLAYYFRSIALTLPDPNLYGGLYALSVPTDGISTGADLPANGEDIVLTVEAHTQGTQSGYIDFPSQHNLGKDAVSESFTDLDVDGSATIDGLIGDDFVPEVYAYTVYIESDATSVDLYAAFEDAGDGTTYKVWLDDTQITPTLNGTTWTVSEEVDMTGVSEKTVRLKKQDSTAGTGGTISYKITIIKKGEYKLDLTDPSKVYDGQPAEAKASMVYTGELYSITDNADEVATNQTLTTGTIGQSSTLHCARRNNTNYRLALQTSVEVHETDQSNVLRYIVTVVPSASSGSFTINDSDGYRMGWDVTYDEYTGSISTISRVNADPAASSATWLTSSATIASAYYGYYYVTLAPADNGEVTVTSSNDYSQDYTLFAIGDAEITSSSSTNTKAEAYQDAQDAIASGATDGQFNYEIDSAYTWSQALTIGKITVSNDKGSYTNNESSTTSTITNSYTQSGTGNYELVVSSDYQQIAATGEELADVTLTYYTQTGTDANGDPLFEGAGTTTPPTDAGTYKVVGELTAETYNASGSRVFTIEQRPVQVLQIENWLVYLTSDEVKTLQSSGATTLAIAASGSILLDNVVSSDDVSLTVDAAGGKLYYNGIDVSFSSDKISLIDPTLGGADAHNYRLVYTNEELLEVRVFGQIAYNMNGAIFRKTEDGDWRKYYPVDNEDPVDASTADYHSPVNESGLYVSHAEYVKARTVNDGSKSARYAVDIEYGPMQFNFYRSVWNVNELVYEELETSYWAGMDGTNNRLVMTNYSNRSVWYQMSAEIDFMYADHSNSGTGITAKITTDAAGTNEVASTAWSEISEATAGNSTAQGTESTSTRYLMLSGIPQMDTSTYIPVGTITVLVSPTDPDSG